MDLGTLITAIVMLAICVLPFVAMNRKKKLRIKQLKQVFEEYIEEQKHTLGEIDLCGKIVIGLNANASHLFFIKERNGMYLKKTVLIRDIQKVIVQKTTFDAASNFEKIALDFDLKSAQIELVFFDYLDKIQLDGELQLAEKWHKKLATLI